MRPSHLHKRKTLSIHCSIHWSIHLLVCPSIGPSVRRNRLQVNSAIQWTQITSTEWKLHLNSRIIVRTNLFILVKLCSISWSVQTTSSPQPNMSRALFPLFLDLSKLPRPCRPIWVVPSLSWSVHSPCFESSAKLFHLVWAPPFVVILTRDLETFPLKWLIPERSPMVYWIRLKRRQFFRPFSQFEILPPLRWRLERYCTCVWFF